MASNFKCIDFLLNIIYPPLCLHCDAPLEEKRTLFCSPCLELLTPIEPQGRCRICFEEVESCKRCATRPIVIKRQAACCHGFGPANALASRLKTGNPQFVQAAASLMALQWAALEWPLPDLVVCLPSAFWAKSGDVWLAKEMARTLCQSYSSALKVAFDRRAFLEKGAFTTRFVLKRDVIDKRILLIAVDLNDAILRQAGEALQAGFAREVYALAFVEGG